MRSCCRKMKGCTKQCGRFNSRFVFSLLSEGVERVFFFFESQHGLWIAEVFCLWCIQERERGTANSGTDETGSADSKEGVMKADTLNGGGDGGGGRWEGGDPRITRRVWKMADREMPQRKMARPRLETGTKFRQVR